jgi:hypothetical protein
MLSPENERVQGIGSMIAWLFDGKFYKVLSHVIVALCKKQFLHKNRKGVEIVNGRERDA